MDLFGTAGIRGPVADVTPALALSVGRAAGADGTDFVVGRDGRTSGPALAAAMTAGLESVGATVERVGTVPTPTLAYASRGRHGVMVTASHNPPTDNGIKLFADGSEYDSDAETRVEERVAEAAGQAEWDRWDRTGRGDPLPDYRDAVVGFAESHGTAPKDLTVAVDCGNGMAGLATPQVIADLDADVVALNANVDGHFPARESKPTPETLTDLRNFVADGDADVGIGHDGDGDRIVIVDSEGEIVHEDTVLAILAEHYTRTSDAADPVVVTTPNASGRIDERIREAGGRTERVHLGGLHEGIERVRADGGEGTTVAFAAEPWKHIHPDFGGWIDAVASAAVLVRLLAGDGLAALREPVTELPYRKESVQCPDKRKADVMGTLESALPSAFPDATVATEYGVRLTFPDDSWTLVRPSGTEPYVRVYAESDEVETLTDAVTDIVADAVS